MTQESDKEAAPVWESHHWRDHEQDDDYSFIRSWRDSFGVLGPAREEYKVVGVILSAYAKNDGTCIHPGNKLLNKVTGYYPQTVNEVLKRLLRDGWIVQTHEPTPTTPRVFSRFP